MSVNLLEVKAGDAVELKCGLRGVVENVVRSGAVYLSFVGGHSYGAWTEDGRTEQQDGLDIRKVTPGPRTAELYPVELPTFEQVAEQAERLQRGASETMGTQGGPVGSMRFSMVDPPVDALVPGVMPGAPGAYAPGAITDIGSPGVSPALAEAEGYRRGDATWSVADVIRSRALPKQVHPIVDTSDPAVSAKARMLGHVIAAIVQKDVETVDCLEKLPWVEYIRDGENRERTVYTQFLCTYDEVRVTDPKWPPGVATASLGETIGWFEARWAAHLKAWRAAIGEYAKLTVVWRHRPEIVLEGGVWHLYCRLAVIPAGTKILRSREQTES